MSIQETIKQLRPQLKENSVKTYSSILRSMYKQVYPDDKEIDISKFQNTEDFLSYLSDYDPSVRKTYLSALVVLTENDEYRTQMMEDIEATKKMKSDNTMTEKQQENQITKKEINVLLADMRKQVQEIYKSKQYLHIIFAKNIEYNYF